MTTEISIYDAEVECPECKHIAQFEIPVKENTARYVHQKVKCASCGLNYVAEAFYDFREDE